MPKLRFDVQLKHRLNQTAKIVAKNFAEGFVDLRCLGFASQTVAKLGFDHAESRFDV